MTCLINPFNQLSVDQFEVSTLEQKRAIRPSMVNIGRYDLARFGPALTGQTAEVITLPRCGACFISAISEEVNMRALGKRQYT